MDDQTLNRLSCRTARQTGVHATSCTIESGRWLRTASVSQCAGARGPIADLVRPSAYRRLNDRTDAMPVTGRSRRNPRLRRSERRVADERDLAGC